jgi:hypothetical protein
MDAYSTTPITTNTHITTTICILGDIFLLQQEAMFKERDKNKKKEPNGILKRIEDEEGLFSQTFRRWFMGSTSHDLFATLKRKDIRIYHPEFIAAELSMIR